MGGGAGLLVDFPQQPIPPKVAYLGNRAAAALKLSGLKHLRQCVADSKLACRFDPGYAKGYAR